MMYPDLAKINLDLLAMGPAIKNTDEDLAAATELRKMLRDIRDGVLVVTTPPGVRMIITPMQLRAVFPTCRNPGVWCRAFGLTLPGTGIDETPQRLAMFLAQCGHESESFNVLRELMSYRTVAQLRAVYPHEFPTDDAAQRYIMNPSGLANFVYANKLGNGDVASGDGFKFRGGGLLQITGRANYEAAGKAISRDLILRPNDVIIEAVAVQTSAYFWNLKDLNAAADAGDFTHTTRAINGPAMEGAAARQAFYKSLLSQLGTPTVQEVAVAARRAVPIVADGWMTLGIRATGGDTPPGQYDE